MMALLWVISLFYHLLVIGSYGKKFKGLNSDLAAEISSSLGC
jgi:hypothetical protein